MMVVDDVTRPGLPMRWRAWIAGGPADCIYSARICDMTAVPIEVHCQPGILPLPWLERGLPGL